MDDGRPAPYVRNVRQACPARGSPGKGTASARRPNTCTPIPEDFVFQLTLAEVANLRSQSVTSSWAGRGYLPLAFTEQNFTFLLRFCPGSRYRVRRWQMADEKERDLAQRIAASIHVVRGQRVMLDADLARLYGVPTKALNQGVRRNPGRFPSEFCFRLDAQEFAELVTNCDRLKALKHSTVVPQAFTEHGALMVANVLNSPRANEVSVYVVRAFLRLRELAITQTRLAQELEKLRGRVDVHDASINAVMEVIGNLLGKPDRNRKRFGFKLEESKPGQKA